eukprot:TRINITY_DN16590_c0_g1_i1.p1 TRINITY_DN16590_c0_g1~~TRINITY_DN16590_c0_g1_i1.p1  ORF type:complete len:223 (-),score=9.97 TRINITY_DN16590_c0_g1_i1:617-1285(-)
MANPVLASFDLGTRQLGLWVGTIDPTVPVTGVRTLRWELIDLESNNADVACRKLIDRLVADKLFYGTVTHVTVESQGCSSAVIRRLSSGFMAHLYTMQKTYPFDLHVSSAKNKLTVWDAIKTDVPQNVLDAVCSKGEEAEIRRQLASNSKRSNRRRLLNKRLAILHVRYILEAQVATGTDVEKWHTIYRQCKKKDDMADSKLQGVYRLRFALNAQRKRRCRR